MKSHHIATALVVLLIATPGTAAAADIQAGKTRDAMCASCHGANGEGSGANPPLAGMPANRFVQSIKDYRSGKRTHAMMKMLATQMDDKDTEDVAAYYASLKKN